jgi:hypothetical protein
MEVILLLNGTLQSKVNREEKDEEEEKEKRRVISAG